MADFFKTRLRPSLHDGEQLLTLAWTTEADLFQHDVFVCVTNQRLIVYRTDPDNVDENKRIHVQFETRLQDIHTVKEASNKMTKTVILHTSHQAYVLPKLYRDTEAVVDTIVSRNGLKQYSNLEPATRQEKWSGRLQKTLAVLGTGSSLALIAVGALFLLGGAIMSLSFVGIFVGVTFAFFGILLITAGIGSLIERRDEQRIERQWVRP